MYVFLLSPFFIFGFFSEWTKATAYTIVLNKYNSIHDHSLLVSNEYILQSLPLTEDELGDNDDELDNGIDDYNEDDVNYDVVVDDDNGSDDYDNEDDVN